MYVITKEQMNNNLIGAYTITKGINDGFVVNKINYSTLRENEEHREVEIRSGFQEACYLNVNERAFFNVKACFLFLKNLLLLYSNLVIVK